ncbi:hypothetical protein [Faecalibacillus faecis]|uniref:hypothetical protein n=1 Tax=Faecalibacillus faecis TaxID=1982628 RepID=UPI003AB56027
MDWTIIFKFLLTATVPALITYWGTKKKCDSKIKEIQISKDAEIKQLKMQHQHEIDKLESDHKHLIEMKELEYKYQKQTKSDDMTSKMTSEFLLGNLDIAKVLNGMDQLGELQKTVEKFKSSNDMSNFVKKK